MAALVFYSGSGLKFSGLILLALVLSACAHPFDKASTPIDPISSVNQGPKLSVRLLPKQERVLLILGQDMGSVSEYAKSGRYPYPGGVTTYLALYQLLSSTYPAYGALGEDSQGKPTGYDVDWGSGRLNANSAALAFPGSALVVGLNIAEGNQQSTWAAGELKNLTLGLHDHKIRRLALFFKSIDNPVYLRIGYEFDGAWNRGYEDSAQYIAAYRRIVDIIREQDVGNLAFVWQASASPIDDLIDGRHENIEDWYPGDNYVDWMGLSWFLPPDERFHGEVTQRMLANEVLNFARSRSKPVMIAESAPQGFDLEQLTHANSTPLWDGPAGASRRSVSAEEIWRAWFDPFFRYIRQNRDIVRAVAYINTDWDRQSKWSAPYSEGYWGDSRVQSNPLINDNWLQQIEGDSFWLHGGPILHEQLFN